MTTDIPKLVILDLYRQAIETVEKLSRNKIDRKIHAWAMKAKKEVGELMLQVASDEMYGEVEETEEEKQRKSNYDFYGGEFDIQRQ